ncbi:hypothetical protein F7725_025424 [Dissostichus mawsoni]|uniref:Uncharacterized protein n=1 Tax=Dissostichus mawsoni TaxID=36200 RepID=A0A7J5XB50_DISMA|nr:hypothetical protein F7725_025424 [Dissostichus mawsoni]
MKVISAAVLSALICTVKEEHRTAFFGEEIHINVPSGNLGEVVFKPRTNGSTEVVLLQAGQVVSPRARLSSPGHLVLEDMLEEDEGVYVIKNTNSPNTAKHLIIIVRGGEVWRNLPNLSQASGRPITLEFRPALTPPNQTEIHHTTEPPPLVLYNQTEVLAEEYVGRLSVSEKKVTLHSVKVTDEGSFTVLDREGKVRRRNCLNVREHQEFLRLTHGENRKIKLYLHHSNANIVYRPKSDHQDRPILEKGVMVTPLDPELEGRLSHPALGVIAFMLLLCLLSCVYRVHMRNEKDKRVILLAQQAGNKEGEAFRQVVHDAYTGSLRNL